MSRFILIGAFLLFTAGTATAQQPQDVKLDCKMWLNWTNEQHTLYLAGYGDAIGILGFGAAASGKSPEEIRQLVNSLWPQGYNLGKLGDELDKLCPTAPFQNMRLSLVITGLAVKAQRGSK